MLKQQSFKGPMQTSQLITLFEDQLNDIYWAEMELTTAIPKMIENATSKELVVTLTTLLGETQEQMERVTDVFESIKIKPVVKKCEAMEGILKEVESIIESCEEGAMRDAGIILAAQKIEHYQIASYETLCVFAKTLGEEDAAALLQHTLDEEKDADLKLSEIAESITDKTEV